MKDSYLFISDLHFGLFNPEREKIRERYFVKFLEFAKDNAKELFILGDLFDHWFEYRRVIQRGYFRTFTAMQDLVEAGVQVHYLIGNHDFLHRDFFSAEIGAKIYEDAIEIELAGKNFFLGHGDGLVKNDKGYNFIKKFLRNKFLQKVYSLIHPDLGIWLASSTSRVSRDYTAGKNYGIGDGLYEAAQKKIDSGFDYVLFGHSHLRKNEKYKNGFYINLGTWLDKPCYGRFNETGFEIIDWN